VPPACLSLEHIESGHHANFIPPVRILEGYKINKRGRILDEEGDTIGELYEGDIIDCVRQRVNAFGEVRDGYGRIVGRARTVSRTQQLLCPRMSSPPSLVQTPATESQQSSYFQWNARSPKISPHRRESATSQSEAFTPAAQQPTNSGHTLVLANELHQYLAPSQNATSERAATALPLSDTTAAHELDPNTSEEEVLVVSHSDVFTTQPAVKSRSISRSTTPSPPGHNADQPSAESELESIPSLPPLAQLPPFIPPPSGDDLAMPPAASNAAASTPPPAQPPRQTTLTPLLRSSSTGSGTDLTKSYARPSMSPVPEDGSVQGGTRATHSKFAYRGEIPSMDGPGTNPAMTSSRSIAARSSLTSSFQRHWSSPEMQGITPSVPSSLTFNSPDIGPRQFKVVPGGRPNYMHKTSFNAPLKRSPLRTRGGTTLASNCFLVQG